MRGGGRGRDTLVFFGIPLRQGVPHHSHHHTLEEIVQEATRTILDKRLLRYLQYLQKIELILSFVSFFFLMFYLHVIILDVFLEPFMIQKVMVHKVSDLY